MADYLPGIVIILIAAAAVFYASRLGAVFTLTIVDGRVAKRAGRVPDQYVEDVERICDLWSVRSGQLWGVRSGSRMRINVGGGIPRAHRQAFQNAWNYPVDRKSP